MKKNNGLIFVFSAIVLCSFGCLKEKIQDNTGLINSGSSTATVLAVNMSTDKAAYSPGDMVTISINQSVPATAHVRYKQAGNIIHDAAVTGNAWTWTAPSADFTGYMVELYDTVKTKEVIYGAIGVDVSSDPSRFPRNGFLSAYGALSSTDINTVMTSLNRYHMNYVQFQDWEYEHQEPLAGTPAAPDPSWKDIANRDNYLNTVQSYITTAHGYGMKALSYNLAYGALSDANAEGVQDSWYLYNDANHNTKNVNPLSSPFKSNIYVLDPSNINWQTFIAEKTNEAYQVYSFDGWQVDQLGDRGTVYNYAGNKVDLTTTFAPFLTAMKTAAPTKRLVMNAVAQYGQAQIATAPVDFLYTEVWSPYDNFSDLANIIQSNDAQTSGAKRSILAAYMDYNVANSAGYFNTPGVIMTDAVIFAFGGSHLELGEHMLGKEYFPNANLVMPADLKTAMISYYDFLTGYENLLRDGGTFNSPALASADNKVKLNNWPPQLGQVSVIAKDLGTKQVIHLVNFTNANSLAWRDADGKQVKPVTIASPQFTFATSKTVAKIWVASPDFNHGASQILSFTQAGGQVTFTLPSLQYWDMIVVEYQ